MTRSRARQPFLSRDEARRLAEQVLSYSEADDVRVNLQGGEDGNSRFAANQVTTGGEVSNVTVSVTSAFGRRVGSAATNDLSEASLQRVVATSERLARLAPEDPEFLGSLGPQRYADAEPVFESTLRLDAEARAAATAAVTGPAAERGLESTGFLVHRAGFSAVANRAGLFAYAAETRANFTTTVRTPDGRGSGWAGTGAHDWRQVDAAELGRRAIEKAERSRDARPAAPDRWSVVLEPTAVANMVGLMMGQLDARAADEGRSFFARAGGGNRIGDRILDERVTIFSDPEHPDLYSAPFNAEGVPNRRTVWFESGELRSLVYGRFWARRTDREPTGFPSGYAMLGGSDSLEEMIRSTRRGLLVTRFWYIRGVDPRTILFTGLTRDGTFLIEDGRIAHPVQNLRWNESPIAMLNRIEMMGEPVRVSSSESGGLAPAVVVPALKVSGFDFTSVSDAI